MSNLCFGGGPTCQLARDCFTRRRGSGEVRTATAARRFVTDGAAEELFWCVEDEALLTLVSETSTLESDDDDREARLCEGPSI